MSRLAVHALVIACLAAGCLSSEDDPTVDLPDEKSDVGRGTLTLSASGSVTGRYTVSGRVRARVPYRDSYNHVQVGLQNALWLEVVNPTTQDASIDMAMITPRDASAATYANQQQAVDDPLAFEQMFDSARNLQGKQALHPVVVVPAGEVTWVLFGMFSHTGIVDVTSKVTLIPPG